MTQNSFRDNINTIKEIYPGVYQIILDFASNRFIKFALRDSHEFIWIHSFELKNNMSWISRDLPISDKMQMNVLARQITYDFIVKTSDYAKLENEIPNGVTLLQINNLPPDYLDLKRLEGKTRYAMLKKECDFLFEINLPSAIDYGTLISTNRDFMDDLINNKEINWKDLP